MIFPAKTVILVANVQSTLVWGASDFQAVLGYAQPEQPISMTFSVANNTSQVCYIAISFQTRNVTYNINDRRSIAGIPAGSTLRISSNIAAELASLGPDLISVTLYLISAAGGGVTVVAEAFDSRTSPGSLGSGQNIGLDQRAVADYVQVRLSLSQLVPGGGGSNMLYTVPAGKRAEIVSFSADCDPTPLGVGDSTVTLNSSGYLKTLNSQPFEAAQVFLAGVLCTLEAGDFAQLFITNFNPNPAVIKALSGIVIIKEYFS